jgi:hypothetical protein
VGTRLPLKPILPTRPVRPYPPKPFHLGDQDTPLFERIAREHTHIIGCDIEYWVLDVQKSKTDPVYGEPLERSWAGPYRVVGYAEYPAGTTTSDEIGTRISWVSTAWISRLAFEQQGTPVPGEGDILHITWERARQVFSGAIGGDGDVVPPGQKIGYYFDVIQVDDDGHIFDSAAYVGYRYDLKRRSEFMPERKLP